MILRVAFEMWIMPLWAQAASRAVESLAVVWRRFWGSNSTRAATSSEFFRHSWVPSEYRRIGLETILSITSSIKSLERCPDRV